MMLATGIMNMGGTFLFTPAASRLRDSLKLPALSHPLYLWIIALWIFAFGVAYLSLAITGRPERLFIAVGAFGKAVFSLLLIGYSIGGTIPLFTASLGLSDLFFAVIFVRWLYQTREGRDLPMS